MQQIFNIPNFDTESKTNICSLGYKCDKKHKLNTTNANIPDSVIQNIDNGITLEQINDLIANGYDIYKYQTQITLHGICNSLTTDTVGQYKSIILNKNKSIGIKWIAVDRQKKLQICDTLYFFGWSRVQNSTELHPCKCERVADKQQAIDKANEYRALIEKIDKTLFYGDANIFIAPYCGMYYVVLELRINGIMQENISVLLNQLTDSTEQERNDKIKEIKDQREKEYQLSQEKHRIEREKQDKEDKEKTSNLEKELKDAGYVKTTSDKLKKNDIFCIIANEYSGVKLKFYIKDSRSCKRCDKNGEISWNADKTTVFHNYKREVYIKA